MKPSALVAFEFATAPGVGQAAAAPSPGRYLELGVSPGYSGTRASLSVPVKVGISLANYYELNIGTSDAPLFEGNAFGYFSVAGLVTVPLGRPRSSGRGTSGGGVEIQALGDTTEALNGGDGSRVIGSIGLGFSY